MYHNLCSALIVWVILGGIQGHPSQRSGDQKSSKHNVATSLTVPANVTNTRRIVVPTDGKIIFPSDLPDPSHRFHQTPPPPAICEDATYCEDSPEYPTDLIKEAIKSRDDLKHLANTDMQVPEIGQRFDGENDVALCMFEDRVIVPKSGQTKDNEWRWIINDDEFVQGVKIEKCLDENSACNLADEFPDGYRPFCKQKYVYRMMASLTSDGTADKELFRFAASCCCHVKFAGPSARFGAAVGVEKSKSQSPASKMAASRAVDTEKK